MALLMALMCLAPRLAQATDAESIVLAEPTLTVSAEGGWVLQANVQVRLSTVLVEAVRRGVPLYFVSEFELLKNRWWWLDKKLFSQTKTVRLSYHAVTQQYRVAVGGLHQMTYETLDEALLAAVSMRGWRVKDPAESLGGELASPDWNASTLEPRLRVRLDSSQLPKPLQINAITNRDWNLSSDWVAPKIAVFSDEAAKQ
jgi:hypothetical protein